METRDAGINYDQLHHFIASGVWDAAPLEKSCSRRQTDKFAARRSGSFGVTIKMRLAGWCDAVRGVARMEMT